MMSIVSVAGIAAISSVHAEDAAPAVKVLATEGFVRGGLATKASHSDIAMAVSALVPISQKGVADGVASLGADGKVPTAQLPDSATAAQVNADWNATSGAAQILNKPTVAPNDVALVHTTGDESIAGTKTFTGAVAVPAQTLP
jgi:hypothetical protein